MEASVARGVLKAPSKEVTLVLGRFTKGIKVEEFSAPYETTETCKHFLKIEKCYF